MRNIILLSLFVLLTFLSTSRSMANAKLSSTEGSAILWDGSDLKISYTAQNNSGFFQIEGSLPNSCYKLTRILVNKRAPFEFDLTLKIKAPPLGKMCLMMIMPFAQKIDLKEPLVDSKTYTFHLAQSKGPPAIFRVSTEKNKK